MYRLVALGGLTLANAAGGVAARQRRRLALLALLAPRGEHGMTRDKLLGYLWPEQTAERARHALEQLIYYLRREVSGDSSPAVTRCVSTRGGDERRRGVRGSARARSARRGRGSLSRTVSRRVLPERGGGVRGVGGDGAAAAGDRACPSALPAGPRRGWAGAAHGGGGLVAPARGRGPPQRAQRARAGPGASPRGEPPRGTSHGPGVRTPPPAGAGGRAQPRARAFLEATSIGA